MRTIISLSREKLLGLALTVLAIIVGSWAIYFFGPRPEMKISSQAPANQPITAPSPKQERAPQTLGADLFNELFKASTTQSASGRTGDSPAKYSESLETVYRRRGYRKLDQQAGEIGEQNPGKLRSQMLNQLRKKVYWRTEAGGIYTIAAWGEDADPTSERPGAKTNGQKQMYLTAVSPAEGGGAQWTTYRYLDDTSQLNALNNQLQSGGDWPGQDPPEVPRPSGLRRLVSIDQLMNQARPKAGQSSTVMVVYQAQQQALPLAEWYMKEMPLAGWNLLPQAGQSHEKMPGVLHFTKGNRSCLVWITPGAGSDPTSVIISARVM
jgi:hypothetical protein